MSTPGASNDESRAAGWAEAGNRLGLAPAELQRLQVVAAELGLVPDDPVLRAVSAAVDLDQRLGRRVVQLRRLGRGGIGFWSAAGLVVLAGLVGGAVSLLGPQIHAPLLRDQAGCERIGGQWFPPGDQPAACVFWSSPPRQP